jgi:hypothetical protein
MIGQAIINEGYTLTVSQAACDEFALEHFGSDNARKGLRGRTSFEDRNVTVGDLPPWDLCQVLAHEFAHVLLHGEARARYRPDYQRELEAESVSRHVLAAFGVNDDDWSSRYIGLYLDSLEEWEQDDVLRASARTIADGTVEAVTKVRACEPRTVAA